jgi:hypothetical protein
MRIESIMVNQKIKDAFESYLEVTDGDSEAAAILVLASIVAEKLEPS